jgi:hypothetical protein
VRSREKSLGSIFGPCQLLGDGCFQLTVMAALGWNYTLLASTNLTDWTAIAGFVSTNFPMTIVDSAATTFPYRFYRIGPLSVRL